VPDIGQICCLWVFRMVASRFMESAGGFGELVARLEQTTRLSRAEAERVVAEVLDYFSESLEGFVIRRHGELQGEELKNAEIFARILVEAGQRRFAAPALSERQVRRIVYG